MRDETKAGMTLEEYQTAFAEQVAFNGFVLHPINDGQLEVCYNFGLSVGDAYELACDVSAGFLFDECAHEYTGGKYHG